MFPCIRNYVFVSFQFSLMLLILCNSKVKKVHGIKERTQRSLSSSDSKSINTSKDRDVPQLPLQVTRVQRGDQGPDDTGELPDNIEIISSSASSSFSRVEHLRGPNVCRSNRQSVCCSGWRQRGRSGLCLVPICNEGSCGLRGRCIKPGLCMCEGGNISPRCVGSGNLHITGEKANGTVTTGIPLSGLQILHFCRTAKFPG